MTGIVLDLFTVILLAIIAFMLGYTAGHKVGRVETRMAVEAIAKNIMDSSKNNKQPTYADIFKGLQDKDKGDSIKG